ncbi:MAG: PTS sugar transporter subunit IIA [Geminicoccaceae bacterium]
MADLPGLLDQDHVKLDLEASSKRHLLRQLADAISAETPLSSREILDVLSDRERLGSTGIGSGVAIPHGKINGLDELHVFFMRLAKPIDFDASDDQPVDLVFTLLAPEGAAGDHLKALARLARRLREPAVVERLRNAEKPQEIIRALQASAQSDG